MTEVQRRILVSTRLPPLTCGIREVERWANEQLSEHISNLFDNLKTLLYEPIPLSRAESLASVRPRRFDLPEFDLERYGADRHGVDDCADAFDAAVATARLITTGGAIIRMPPGTLKITRLIDNIPGRVLLVGAGRNATRINLQNGVSGFRFVNDPATNEVEGGGLMRCSVSHDEADIVVEGDDVWGLVVEDVFFRDGGTAGSARIIKASGECFETRIRNCRFLGATSYCIDLIGICNSSTIEDCDFAPRNGCVSVRVQEAFDCVIKESRFEYAGSDTGVKIEIDQSNSTVIRDNDITQGTSGYAIVIKGGADGTKITGNDFSTSGSGGCVDVQNGDYGIIANNEFQIGSTSGDQIKAGGRTGWAFNGNTVKVDAALASSANLVLIDSSATDWAIEGNEFVGEGSGANGGTGIQIDAGSTQIKVIGNGFNNLHTGIDTQANSASPSVVIEANSFANLTTKVTVGTAASNVITNNVGYRTRNKGTGTIASGSTSVTITHGLDVTPVPGDLTIIPTNNPTNAVGNIYIGTITSTQFDVHVENDPGASTFTFSWRADCVS